jgi:anhydro-N-acetylmuramic acid kinase
MAARGSVSPPLLRELMHHPYLRRMPPKSTGREMFGVPFAERMLRESALSPEDLLATVAAFTAASIHDACRRFAAPRGRVDEVVASGGGCHNRTLMRFLAEAFAPVPVRFADDFGIPVDAKEAMAFAILAHETMAGRPGNLPAATGATRPVILGKILPGRRWPHR